MSTVASYPHEILSAVCAAVFEAADPPVACSLDPLLLVEKSPAPAQLPSSFPPANWSEPISRKTLANLSLVSHAWGNAAKPFLWRKVEVRLPRTWLAFVEQVALDESEGAADRVVDSFVSQATSIALASKPTQDPESALRFHQSLIAQLSGLPHDSIPPELLSPPASRDPSPARLRAKSPGRWRLARAVGDLVHSLEPSIYVPTPDDPRPGRHIRHLDFNHFRTIGMRRSVGEGVHSRFVTSHRLESVLKEMPNLQRFGGTEYMDGALDKNVLIELLLRGKALPDKNDRGRRNESHRSLLHGAEDDQSSSVEDCDEACERRRECKELEALDLCGCVSSVFVQALDEFVHDYLEGELQEDDSRLPSEHSLPGIKRLGMRGVTSVHPSILMPFVLACTHLTHLDLSGTRCTPELLVALADSPSVHLNSLALARCTRLDGDSITEFLINAPAARSIEQLSLYGDGTFISPLSEANLTRIITEAPCFTSGRLEYLDLSSSPLTRQLLQMFNQQPALRSLGLSYIPNLPLSAVSDFVLTRAPNVEVLTLVSTSPELGVAIPWRQLALSLHSLIIRPLASAPFKFSLDPNTPADPPPTRLRVIELGNAALNSLGAGADAWRIVKSKGGRGWYVHSGSGWVNGELRRDLKPDHPVRMELERLAASNGNVSSGVGWHARKMEVLDGIGLLGREDGLYGAVSFAYQG